MHSAASPSATVVVVDPCPSDYDRLADDARRAGMRFDQLSDGQDALRSAPWMAADLWIINTRLPDMSGFELVEQLHARRRGVAVFLVGDTYAAEDERRALSLGVTMYLCKPVHAAWLEHWRAALASVAGTRADRTRTDARVCAKVSARRDPGR